MLLEAAEDGSPKIWNQYYPLLRFVCNTPESLMYSNSRIAQMLRDSGMSFDSSNCAKLEMMLDQLETIQDQGDKAVVFTKWTNLSLHILGREIDPRHNA